MAIANLEKIDSKLSDIYKDQVTTNVDKKFEDKSQLLFEQMNMIAYNNKININLHIIHT